MSELNIIRLQHGQSNTAANNFTTTAEAANGTMKLLARGNPGATTQDIITVDASGVVDHPQGLKIAGTSGQRMMLMAAKATTAGTVVDFSPVDGTGIPSWAKRVTVQFYAVSTSGASPLMVQLGAGAVQTSGYASSITTPSQAAATGGATANTGLVFGGQTATNVMTGHIVITLLSGFNYVASTYGAFEGLNITWQGGGRTTLSGTLDRIRLTTVNGTDTFDAGSVSLLIEGY